MVRGFRRSVDSNSSQEENSSTLPVPPSDVPVFLSRSVSALLQRGLLFAPRLLLAAQMNERQRQASVTMRTRLVASECHLRDRFLVSHRGAAQVLDASPFRLTSEPSPHGHANHLAHHSATVSALLDRSLASHTPCALPGPKKSVVFEVGR